MAVFKQTDYIRCKEGCFPYTQCIANRKRPTMKEMHEKQVGQKQGFGFGGDSLATAVHPAVRPKHCGDCVIWELVESGDAKLTPVKEILGMTNSPLREIRETGGMVKIKETPSIIQLKKVIKILLINYPAGLKRCDIERLLKEGKHRYSKSNLTPVLSLIGADGFYSRQNKYYPPKHEAHHPPAVEIEEPLPKPEPKPKKQPKVETKVEVAERLKEELPQGTKHDQGKLPWHLLPTEATEGMLKVLQYGATGKPNKDGTHGYGERNWEKGIVFSRLIGSIMRHIWAWWGGEDLDPESGLPHLDHAACNISFLQTFRKREMYRLDDRPDKPQPMMVDKSTGRRVEL
jgi:hypothetical protein